MGTGARNLLTVQYGVMVAVTDEDPSGVLEALGAGLGWDIGTLWELERRGDALSARAIWARRDRDAPAFREATRGLRFAHSENRPGRVWATREACWIEDLATGLPMRRADAAHADGLRSGLWFPILSNRDVLGVIELLRRDATPPDRELLEGVETIGRVVGLYLRRVRAEQEHRELSSRVELGARAQLESERQLRALAERIQSIREDERTELSREIHDVLGQELTGLKMDAGWISRRLAERSEPGDPVAERTRAMIGNIDATIAAVRRISAALRPRVLDDLGLVAAAECLARDLRVRSSIEISLVTPDELPLPAPLATAIYRILQELLTNAVRHADARRIEIAIAVDDGAIELRVIDDGKGFVPSALRTNATPSLGLIGIRERARTFGGALAIGERLGGGTEATVRIPVDCGARR